MGQPLRIVIIGNGIAGTTAAENIKKEVSNSQVTLFGDEPYPLYNRVALPPYLKGIIKEERVVMRTEDLHRDRGIDLHLTTRVVQIRADEKEVVTEDGKTWPYDKLLVATGGRVNPLDVPGVKGTEHIYAFQTLDDTRALIEQIHASRSSVVIGGSFIAYELAEGFRSRGLETVWIMRGPRFLRRILDEAGGDLVDRIAKEHGVTMIYNEEIAAVKPRAGTVEAVETKSGRRFDADMVGYGLGMTLNTELLRDSGVEINRGIKTDEFLATRDPDIFAAGDVAEFFDTIVGDHLTMGTWNNSASHGKTAALNMIGAREPYTSVPTYTSGLFDSRIAVMGATPEINPEVEGVSSVDFEERNYKRLFFLGSRLVGAVLIGNMRPRRDLMRLIRSQDPVERREALL